MKLKALAAAVLVVTCAPLAIEGAEGQTARAPAEKRYCTIVTETGSRLGNVRRCRTKAENDALKAETRAAVNRFQTNKQHTESMVGLRAICPGSGSRFC